MNVLQRIVRLLVFVVLLCAGMVSLVLAFSEKRWDGILRLVMTGNPVEFWIGLGFMCLALLFVCTTIRRKQRERFLSFENEGGKVSISTLAISEYVSKVAGEFPAIVRMEPRILPVRNALDIVVDVKIRSGSQIHEVCELLQRRIRESVSSGLGISEIRRVEVSVKQIVLEHRPA